MAKPVGLRETGVAEGLGLRTAGGWRLSIEISCGYYFLDTSQFRSVCPCGCNQLDSHPYESVQQRWKTREHSRRSHSFRTRTTCPKEERLRCRKSASNQPPLLHWSRLPKARIGHRRRTVRRRAITVLQAGRFTRTAELRNRTSADKRLNGIRCLQPKLHTHGELDRICWCNSPERLCSTSA